MQNHACGDIFTDVRSVAIIGAGRVGGAMAIALEGSGYSVDTVVFRGERYLGELKNVLPDTVRFARHSEFHSFNSEILIIASGDPDIPSIAEWAAHLDHLPRFALHTSGSLSSLELDVLAKTGVSTASLHPLAAVSDPITGPERFRGAYFCVEGDAEAVEIAEKIARDMGGKPFSIPTHSKSLYHASAVMSAGHIVALMDAAIEMMTYCGLSSEEARDALLPLASGAVANLLDRPPASALTGPYARGDASALERHLSAFAEAEIPSSLRALYLDLAERSVAILTAAGRRDLEALAESIRIAKQQGE